MEIVGVSGIFTMENLRGCGGRSDWDIVAVCLLESLCPSLGVTGSVDACDGQLVSWMLSDERYIVLAYLFPRPTLGRYPPLLSSCSSSGTLFG